MFFAMVTFFPHSQINDIFFSESQMFFWLHKHRFWYSFFCSVLLFVLNVSWGNFYISNWTSNVFICQYSNVLGLPAIFPLYFQHIRTANVFYICCVICFVMNSIVLYLFFVAIFIFRGINHIRIILIKNQTLL